MPTKPLSDEQKRRALEAFIREGSIAAAARSLNMDRNTYRNRLRQAQEDPAIANAKAAIGTNMTPALVWAKTKDEDGNGFSVLLKPDAVQDDTMERIRDAFEGIKPAKAARAPQATMADLCTVYPLFDVHFGMHAWGKETGSADYDLKLARTDLSAAFAKVDILTPASDEAVLLIGGDFFHMDDERNETPGHKNKLDVDGRFYKVISDGIEALVSIIHRLLKKHRHLTIRVLRGNHDPHAHVMLTVAMAQRYREEPRATVEQTPRDLFMKQWGNVAVFGHHGDKARPERMALYLSDICPFWSATRHRHMLTGHVHHDQAKDIGPLRWESLRAFCPPDAYAAGMGYGARRALQAITFHKTDGLVLRAIDPIERAA